MNLHTRKNPGKDGASVVDVSLQNFMPEVAQASLKLPVLVYFWSPRFPQCVEYGALLEKQVQARVGKVKLARLNVDANPEIAQQFQIQALPMVYIFLRGQPVDGFAGNLPEAEIKKYLDKLAGKDEETLSTEALLEQAKIALSENRTEEAEERYRYILDDFPQEPKALAGLARALLAQGRNKEAVAALAQIPADKMNDPEVAGAKAALALASAGSGENIGALTKKLEKNAEDHQARYDLATALFATGRQEEAIEELLTLFHRNREWNEQAARKQLLTFFEALGPTHPLTVAGRKKLSSIMFA